MNPKKAKLNIVEYRRTLLVILVPLLMVHLIVYNYIFQPQLNISKSLGKFVDVLYLKTDFAWLYAAPYSIFSATKMLIFATFSLLMLPILTNLIFYIKDRKIKVRFSRRELILILFISLNYAWFLNYHNLKYPNTVNFMFIVLSLLCFLIKKIASGLSKFFLNPKWVVFVFFIALATRYPLTTNPTMAWDYGYHLDFTRQILAQYPRIPEITTGNRAGDFFEYPPLAYFILASAYKFIFPTTTLFHLGRWLQILASSLGVFPIFYLTKSVFNQRIAPLAALLYALYPIAEIGHQFTTSFGVVLFIAVIYFLQEGLKGKDIVPWGSAGILNGLLLLTHHLSAAVATLCATVIITLKGFNNVKKKWFLKGVISFALISAIIGALWWYPILERNIGKLSDANELRTHQNTKPAYCVENRKFRGEYFSNYSLVFTGGLVGLFYARRRDSTLVLCVTTLGILLISTAIKLYFLTFSERFFVYFISILEVFSAAGILYVFDKSETNNKRKIIYAVLLLFIYTNQLAEIQDTLEVSPTIKQIDLTALKWLGENAPSHAIVATDSSKAYWLPYLSGLGAINGREGSEFTDETRDVAIAKLFSSTTTEAETNKIIYEYNVRYAYVAKDSGTRFPDPADQDCHGNNPAVYEWDNFELHKLDRLGFPRVFDLSETSGERIIYRLI